MLRLFTRRLLSRRVFQQCLWSGRGRVYEAGVLWSMPLRPDHRDSGRRGAVSVRSTCRQGPLSSSVLGTWACLTGRFHGNPVHLFCHFKPMPRSTRCCLISSGGDPGPPHGPTPSRKRRSQVGGARRTLLTDCAAPAPGPGAGSVGEAQPVPSDE